MKNRLEDNRLKIMSIKEQFNKTDGWLKERLDTLLPQIMKRENIDMWIILAREYNEDPVFLTLIPALQRTASRLSCLVFWLGGEGDVECLNLGRPNPLLNTLYKQAWNPKHETQWQCIRRIADERRPKTIAINVSQTFALADGLTKSLHDELLYALGEEHKDALVNGENLCVGWLETRTQSELDAYPEIYDIAIEIIEEGFSKHVITPGKTTTTDVEWWMMDRINNLGLRPWFSPTVDLQRKGGEGRITGDVILPGDMLHCDIGIEYLGLCTDTQRLAYVLRDGEKDEPQGIRDALSTCNQFQDIVAKNFLAGRSGNEILLKSLTEAKEKEIKAMLYTHPIGYHGHAAGPTIGMWDNQNPIPLRGDYPLYLNTCHALELNTASQVPEWDNQEIYIYLEETISFTQSGVEYLRPRQKEFIII